MNGFMSSNCRRCELVVRIPVSQGLTVTADSQAPNDLCITLCLGPFPSSLELQQMVEVCSRAPAIGECVSAPWFGVAMRCH